MGRIIILLMLIPTMAMSMGLQREKSYEDFYTQSRSTAIMQQQQQIEPFYRKYSPPEPIILPAPEPISLESEEDPANLIDAEALVPALSDGQIDEKELKLNEQEKLKLKRELKQLKQQLKALESQL